MVIKAVCSNCKRSDGNADLLNLFCKKHKKRISYPNEVCRYWQPSLKDMDVWISRIVENKRSMQNDNK